MVDIFTITNLLIGTGLFGSSIVGSAIGGILGTAPTSCWCTSISTHP